MNTNEGKQLRTAVDIAAKFNFAVYQVINEIKKIGFNVGRNEILDENLIERIVTIFEDKNNVVEQMAIDRQKKALADEEEWNKLLESFELEETSDVQKEENSDFFAYALENFDKALLKLENASEILANSLFKSNKFNFDNIYLIAQKEETVKKGVFEYSLYCMQSENEEIYTSIWDNEESLVAWKAANFVQDEYCRIEFNEFYLVFILQNKGNIKNIFLNTPTEINEFSSGVSAAIENLELFSAIGCWPAIKYFLLKKGMSDVFIELIESFIAENVSLSKNHLLSLIEKIEINLSQNPFNHRTLYLEFDNNLHATLSISLSRFIFDKEILSIVKKLSSDQELVEMTEAFIDDLPVDFYTNPANLYFVDHAIAKYLGDFVDTFLISDKEKREAFLNEYPSSKYNNEATLYVEGRISLLARFVKEKNDISDDIKAFLATYDVINETVIKYLSKKWENDHGQDFQDISYLDLDGSIARYCDIETIAHSNNNSIGSFVYYLISQSKFEQGSKNFLDCLEIFMPKFNTAMEQKKYVNFSNRLKRVSAGSQKKYSINDVDLMTGHEFEKFIVDLFSAMGYETEITKATGDQGIDVIASKNGNKIGIQAKCYSSSVSNSAIQEVVAGKNHYRLDKAIVITNNVFTESARILAQSNSVILWDREILKQKIEDILKSKDT